MNTCAIYKFYSFLSQIVSLSIAIGNESAKLSHVGNDFETDAKGSHGAGWGVVWLNREGAPRPDNSAPCKEIRTLAELYKKCKATAN